MARIALAVKAAQLSNRLLDAPGVVPATERPVVLDGPAGGLGDRIVHRVGESRSRQGVHAPDDGADGRRLEAGPLVGDREMPETPDFERIFESFARVGFRWAGLRLHDLERADTLGMGAAELLQQADASSVGFEPG